MKPILLSWHSTYAGDIPVVVQRWFNFRTNPTDLGVTPVASFLKTRPLGLRALFLRNPQTRHFVTASGPVMGNSRATDRSLQRTDRGMRQSYDEARVYPAGLTVVRLAMALCGLILGSQVVTASMAAEDSAAKAADYTGSAVCAGCHEKKEAKGWKASQHAHAMQEATEAACSATSTQKDVRHRTD